MRRLILFCLAVALGCAGAAAAVRLPALFQDGMVVQRGKALHVWGTAEPGETIAIAFRGKRTTATADGGGQWSAELPAGKAGGPFTLTVGERTINDVLVGDVWLCSGQSNMDVMVERVSPQYDPATFDFADDNIRLLRVRNTTNTHGPCEDFPTDGWHKVCRKSAWNFSAIGYFLAREMRSRTGVPQGVIVNSWGGTPIEAWLPADTVRRYWPKMYSETMLYQDDRLVGAMQEASSRAGDQWNRTLDELDPGMGGQWMAAATSDSDWQKVSQDGRVYEGRDLCGSLWLRQHITIDKAHAGRPATLLLGTMYDCDHTYVNGIEVGRTYYEYPPRRYKVREGLLREGDNVITIRFINKAGVPHFYKQKPYRLDFGGGDTIALCHDWLARKGVEVARQPNVGVSLQNLPATLYNAVLAPLAPYTVAGVVWYQGESNTGRSSLYRQQLTQLMGSWRGLWGDSQLPFVVCQLANYMQPSATPQESGWAELREGQRLAAEADPHAELAVLIDLGEAVDIHPLRKREAAGRIADCMESLAFGKKTPLSPKAVAAKAEGGTVTVAFDQTLQSGELHEWELQSADGRWHNAKANAAPKSKNVTIACPDAPQPKAVRYAWKNNPDKADTRGTNGKPAAPMRMEL